MSEPQNLIGIISFPKRRLQMRRTFSSYFTMIQDSQHGRHTVGASTCRHLTGLRRMDSHTRSGIRLPCAHPRDQHSSLEEITTRMDLDRSPNLPPDFQVTPEEFQLPMQRLRRCCATRAGALSGLAKITTYQCTPSTWRVRRLTGHLDWALIAF